MPAHEHHQMVKTRDLFRRHGGVLRTNEALRLGIHPRTLYRMRENGDLDQLTRGLYRLSGLPKLSDPDLVTVSLKVPKAVICLISALALHDLTTQVPHHVYIALPRGTEPPRIPYPPLRISWFAESAYREGIETRKSDGIAVRVYSAEKTIADCFKYRNKIGLDVPLEALKLYRRRRKIRTDDLSSSASTRQGAT